MTCEVLSHLSLVVGHGRLAAEELQRALAEGGTSCGRLHTASHGTVTGMRTRLPPAVVAAWRTCRVCSGAALVSPCCCYL